MNKLQQPSLQENTPSYEQLPSGGEWDKSNMSGLVIIGTRECDNPSALPVEIAHCFLEKGQLRVFSTASRANIVVPEGQCVTFGRRETPEFFEGSPYLKYISREHFAISWSNKGDGKIDIRVFDRNSSSGTFCSIEEDKNEDEQGLEAWIIAGNQEGERSFLDGKMTGITETAAEGRGKDNEDGIYLNPELGIIATADGVGGHGRGAEASRHIIEAFHAAVSAGHNLKSAIYEAGAHLVRMMPQRTPSEKPPGAAFSAARLHKTSEGKKYVEVVNVGDTRVIVVSGKRGELRYRSVDQSIVGVLLSHKRITEQEAFGNVYKHIITNAISADGITDPPNGATFWVEDGDYVVTFTDGIADFMSDEDVAFYCLHEGSEAAREIVETAKNRQNQKEGFNVLINGEKVPVKVNHSDNIGITIMKV